MKEASAQAVEAPGQPTQLPLLAVQQIAEQCTRCELHRKRNRSVFARGNGSSRVVFVGEGPGAEEDRRGLPFVGAAGKLLDRMIVAMGLDLESVYICNIVKCRPPQNRKPEPREVAECSPLLAQQLTLIRPKVIIALGATAMQGLVGTSVGITRLRGQWHEYKGGVPVMPTFHPAFLLRQSTAKREVWQDLQKVVTLLSGTSSSDT